MAKSKKSQKQNKVISGIFTAVAVVFLFIGGLAWWGYSFASGMVRDELTAQKIYFPPAGSPALSEEEFPHLQKYGGQLVDDGFKAKGYASYIENHLKKTAGGKTYSEISNEARANPDNQELQEQRQSLFMGETLRGILLGTGYAYWVIGLIAKYAALALFVLAGASLVGAVYVLRRN